MGLETILGFLTANFVPKNLTLGSGRMAKWYKSNGYFKFCPGQLIKLKSKNILGYEQLPERVYSTHRTNNTEDAYFLMDMSTGEGNNYSKWNVENHFKGINYFPPFTKPD